MCRHTEASVCRNCPAKQRAEGGRQPRAHEPRCDPQDYIKRWKIFNFHKRFMTEESFQDADDATSCAGVGKRFGGGTACGRAAPSPGQALTATRKTMSSWKAQRDSGNWGNWGNSSNWQGSNWGNRQGSNWQGSNWRRNR